MDDIMKVWLEANKNGKLTMDHPLNEDSVVLDIGSYTGKWSFKLYEKYKCNIFSYEPVKMFYEEHKKAIGNRKIKVFNYALDVKDGKQAIFFQKDGSSFLIKNSSTKIEVETKSVTDEFNRFKYINLVKMNIEGSEFDVIDALYQSGEIQKPHRFMIQFHKIPGYEAKLAKTQNQLSETHKKLWGYGTIWELWEKK